MKTPRAWLLLEKEKEKGKGGQGSPCDLPLRNEIALLFQNSWLWWLLEPCIPANHSGVAMYSSLAPCNLALFSENTQKLCVPLCCTCWNRVLQRHYLSQKHTVRYDAVVDVGQKKKKDHAYVQFLLFCNHCILWVLAWSWLCFCQTSQACTRNEQISRVKTSKNLCSYELKFFYCHLHRGRAWFPVSSLRWPLVG